MPTSWGSDTVNGQLVPRTPSSAVFPVVYSPQYTGPGYWPRQGAWQVPPFIANPEMRTRMAPSTGVEPGVGPTQEDENGNPFHPTKGTVIFGFGALVVGLFLLRYVHW